MSQGIPWSLRFPRRLLSLEETIELHNLMHFLDYTERYEFLGAVLGRTNPLSKLRILGIRSKDR